MQLAESTVIVRDLEILVRIGVHEHERQAAQKLLVSVEATLASGTGEVDELSSTLDYDAVCDFIRALAHREHVLLQETLARRILDFTLSLPGAVSAVVETRKPNIFDDCAYVGVRLRGKNA